MPDFIDHPPYLGAILMYYRIADFMQSQTPYHTSLGLGLGNQASLKRNFNLFGLLPLGVPSHLPISLSFEPIPQVPAFAEAPLR